MWGLVRELGKITMKFYIGGYNELKVFGVRFKESIVI